MGRILVFACFREKGISFPQVLSSGGGHARVCEAGRRTTYGFHSLLMLGVGLDRQHGTVSPRSLLSWSRVTGIDAWGSSGVMVELMVIEAFGERSKRGDGFTRS